MSESAAQAVGPEPVTCESREGAGYIKVRSTLHTQCFHLIRDGLDTLQLRLPLVNALIKFCHLLKWCILVLMKPVIVAGLRQCY